MAPNLLLWRAFTIWEDRGFLRSLSGGRGVEGRDGCPPLRKGSAARTLEPASVWAGGRARPDRGVQPRRVRAGDRARGAGPTGPWRPAPARRRSDPPLRHLPAAARPPRPRA